MTLRNNLRIYVGLTALIIMVFLPQHYFNSMPDDITSCVHARVFGVKCPGCGFTRATYNFLHLNFKKAISLNPTVIFLCPIVALEILCLIIKVDAVRKARYFTYTFFVVSLFSLYLVRILNI
jgi:hypothetical protein